MTGLGDGVVGLAQGAESLGKAVLGVAQFSREVMTNDPAAVETAGKAGESVGKLMVGGIRVYSAAESYLESVGAATTVGDYAKALRDVAWLGQQMNNRWDAMSPEEKTNLVTQLTVENLGAIAVGFGTDKLAKSIKITEALEALGAEAGAMGAGVREKAKKLISGMADELMPQPIGVTPDGHLMPIPKNGENLEDLATKMVGRSGEYVPERKPMFLAPGPNKVLNEREIEAFGGLKKLEAMSDGELAGVGLKRYEFPKIKLESDQLAVKATIPGNNRTYFRAEMKSPGVVIATDLYRGELPKGTGASFFVEGLKAHGALPTERLILNNVINKESLEALRAGALPEDTFVAKVATKALKQLGITPTAYRYEFVGDKVNIVIETGAAK